jgi:hypothetical protein
VSPIPAEEPRSVAVSSRSSLKESLPGLDVPRVGLGKSFHRLDVFLHRLDKSFLRFNVFRLRLDKFRSWRRKLRPPV